MENKKDTEMQVRLPPRPVKDSDPESDASIYKISQKDYPEGDKGNKGERKHEVDKFDPNIKYYSRYITEHDTHRIIYALHRLLHNYVMFRCVDRHITEGILSEGFIEKLSEGFNIFLKDCYFYDPYYQPISFKRRYGYIEVHVKVGVNDVFANYNRIFKKVFLVIFHRGSVKFVLTKYNRPGQMIPNTYTYAVDEKRCRDVWCRVDFITSIVNRRHRRIKHREIENLYDILINDEKGFFRLSEELEDRWICIDFDTESEYWSRTERGQFIRMMRKESDPYFIENRKYVDPLETKLEHEKRRHKRKQKYLNKTEVVFRPEKPLQDQAKDYDKVKNLNAPRTSKSDKKNTMT